MGGSDDSMKVSDDSKEQTTEDDEVDDNEIDKIFSEMLIPPPVSAILMTPRITEDANNFSEQLVGFQSSQKLHSDDSKEQSNENVEKVHEANDTDDYLKGSDDSKNQTIETPSPKAVNRNLKSNAPLTLLQVNLCQKLLFLHKLTHNLTTYCLLNYKFNT